MCERAERSIVSVAARDCKIYPMSSGKHLSMTGAKNFDEVMETFVTSFKKTESCS